MTHSPVALPARDLADAPLARAFAQPGCPVCRRVADVQGRFIDGVLYESVNDVGFRADFDAARGFCRRHVHQVLRANRDGAGGVLSTSILLAAMLRLRRRELEAAVGARGRSRAKRLETSRAPADCQVCHQGAIAAANAIDSLVRLVAEPAWAEALATAPLCLEHLTLLLRAAPDGGSMSDVARRQLERLGTLEARLEAFAHHSAQDRRHLLGDEERASVDEAAEVLGGSPG